MTAPSTQPPTLPPDSVPSSAPPSQAKDGPAEIGYVLTVKDYLVSINGLPKVAINEVVTTEGGARGVVTALKNNLVEVLMLDDAKIRPQQQFTRTYQSLSVEIGPYMLGRTINALGTPIDGKARFKPGPGLSIDQAIRGIRHREIIKNQFETGVTTIDTLIPLAKGQKELIMGDARSGKTSFIIDLIVNQREKDTICVYAIVGKSGREIRQLVDILAANKALPYTTVVAASSSDLASLIYLTPGVALTVAEYFQRQGKNVLVILDDLGLHAKFYREISLLGGRTPGRESYPGDIFYQHARLMERAGAFNQNGGGGSITILPVIEIHSNDYTGFISTNLMAMTDGHLSFDANLYHKGTRPAIDTSLSVSRVGRQTQSLAQKILSDKVRSTLAQASKVETLSRFGSEVSSETQLTLKHQSFIKIILKQPPLTKIPLVVQAVILGLVFTPFLMERDEAFLRKNLTPILNYLKSMDLQALEKELMNLGNEADIIKRLSDLRPELDKVCQT